MRLFRLRSATAVYLLWVLLAVYATGRSLELLSGGVPTLTIVALQVLAAGFVAIVHGYLSYGSRGILMFVSLCLIVGSVLETLSLRTGFPFGRYYFTDVMGPQFFHLPPLLVLAYIGMGYASWVLGLSILGNLRRPVRRYEVVILPLISSFIMVAWDLACEPIWANVAHAWVWMDGGPFFGVPISNFFGWYLTAYFIYQLFALYVRSQDLPNQLPSQWRFPVLLYAVCAGSNLLFALPAFRPTRRPAVFTDGAGHSWRMSDILAACVVISLFVMIPFALMAWVSASSGTVGDIGSHDNAV